MSCVLEDKLVRLIQYQDSGAADSLARPAQVSLTKGAEILQNYFVANIFIDRYFTTKKTFLEDTSSTLTLAFFH